MIQIIQYFTHGKDYGSLIKIQENFEYEQLIEIVQRFGEKQTEGLFVEEFKQKVNQLINLITVAKILSNKYEIVVTNPPYMGSSGMDKALSDFVKKQYPNSKSDLFAVFIEQCDFLASQNGYCGMITQQSWMFLSSFEKLRIKLIEYTTIINMANLGARAFEEIGGEVVQTTTFILNKAQKEKYRGNYIRLVDFKSQVAKQEAYKNAIDSEVSEIKFVLGQNNFKKIPGMPIAYNLTKKSFDAYSGGKPLGQLAKPRKGNSTSDNQRFLRLWFEVEKDKLNIGNGQIDVEDSKKRRWYPYNKGGGFRKWYGLNEYVIDWYNDAYEIRNIKTAVIANYDYFMKPGLTWSTVSSKKFSLRRFGKGFIFDNGGCCIFDLGENENYLLGLLNSNVFIHLFGELNPTLNFQSGEVAKFPVLINSNYKKKIDEIVDENVKLSKEDWDSNEISWDFKRIDLLKNNSDSLNIKDAVEKSIVEQILKREKMHDNEIVLNSIYSKIYKLEQEVNKEVLSTDISYTVSKKEELIRNLISYSVGIIFARYSLDEDGLIYAGGEWDPSRYQKFKPDADNVLLITDDEYFKDSQIDIVNRFIDFVEVTFGEDTLEENLQFIADTLGGKGTSREIIRRYFVKDFYKDHLKTYSNRPIYWQLDSGKQNGFKALMYLHRYTPDQLGKVRTEYLHELQKAYDNRIELRQQQISTSDNPKERNAMTKEIAKIQKQLKEVREYDEKLGHLALKRIELDLDDGVIVNYDKLQRDPKTGEKFQILAKGVKEPKK